MIQYKTNKQIKSYNTADYYGTGSWTHGKSETI